MGFSAKNGFRKISVDSHAKIISDFTEKLIPVTEIAKEFSVTRMAIYKILRAHGVDVATCGSLTVKCHSCEKEITKPRCQVRKNRHSFCSRRCFNTWLNRRDPENPLITYRHGLRLAKQIISPHFYIPPCAVVHHEDRNQNNNALSNLKVFANQTDHVKYHREQNVEPIWDGSKRLKISI